MAVTYYCVRPENIRLVMMQPKSGSILYCPSDMPASTRRYLISLGFQTESCPDRQEDRKSCILLEDPDGITEWLTGAELGRRSTGINVTVTSDTMYRLESCAGGIYRLFAYGLSDDELRFARSICPGIQTVTVRDMQQMGALRAGKKVMCDMMPGSKVLHYVGAEQDGTKIYRRFCLNRYIRENGGADTVYIRTCSEIFSKKYSCIVCSDGRNTAPYIYKARLDNSVLVYDRTDNWSALGSAEKRSEDNLIAAADYIFCSSRYLYDTLPPSAKKKAELIANGCYAYPYEKKEKLPVKTAVYAGRSPDKMDLDFVRRLAKKNSGWNFRFYGVHDCDLEKEGIPNISFFGWIPDTELHQILLTAHAGIIPFVKDEWTAGMLPLKLFHYTMAHIPTGYTGSDECRRYPTAFDISDLNLDRLLSARIPESVYDKCTAEADWNHKFARMLDKTGIRKL